MRGMLKPVSANEPIVRFDKVQKSYDGETLVVKNLNLDIPKGEFLTMLGPSGSGKTTLGRAIAGLIQPTSGDIHIDDTDIRGIVAQLYATKLLEWSGVRSSGEDTAVAAAAASTSIDESDRAFRPPEAPAPDSPVAVRNPSRMRSRKPTTRNRPQSVISSRRRSARTRYRD